MPSVLIDGVAYVPRADIPALTDERLRAALGELVAIQYFYACSRSALSRPHQTLQ